VRWKGARFVPLSLVGALFIGAPLDEEDWKIDGPSQCLLPAGRGGVFRTVVRSSAAVDRWSGAVEPHTTAAIEFFPGAGLWAVVSFADDEARQEWGGPLRAAFRLLADSGFGGRRSHGWGRAEEPEFVEGALPEMILSFDGAQNLNSWWMLSLFTPDAADSIDWNGGNYALVTRGGRVHTMGDRKKDLPMVVEGSVLAGPAAPRGAAPDVAPDGFAHPVYRAGFAVAIPVPGQVAI
jgi:CRISPR type III-A-associated RAMP protein Csm4